MSWSHLQSNNAFSTSSSSSVAVTLGSSTPAGHLVVVNLVSNVTGATLADSSGNTWTALTPVTNPNNDVVFPFYSIITHAGTLTITGTLSQSNYAAMAAAEFSGTNPALAAGPSGAHGAGTAAATGSLSTTGNALVVAGVFLDTTAGGTATPGSGYTLDTGVDYVNGSHLGQTVVYKLNDASGSATPSVGYATSTTWTMAGYTFAEGASQATLSGPTTGALGAQSTAFTVTLNGPAPTGGVVVTPASTGGSDTFQATVGGANVTTITIAAGATTGTFYLNPSGVTGNRNVSITTSPVLTYSGSPIAYNAANAVATGYTIGGATTAVVGAASAPITVTPNGLVSGTDTVTIVLAGVQGTLSSTTLTFANSAAAQQVTLNASMPGAALLSFSSALRLAMTSSPWVVSVAAASLPVTFVSILQAGQTGLATSFTLTPQVLGAGGITTPLGSTVGPAAEIGASGTYCCLVSYQSSTLPAGTWPVVKWATTTANYSDPQPFPLAASTTAWAAPYYRSVEVLY